MTEGTPIPRDPAASTNSGKRRSKGRVGRTWLVGLSSFALVGVVAAFGVPVFLQDSLTYFPRRYSESPPTEQADGPGFQPYFTQDGLQQWGYRIDPPLGAPSVPEGLPEFYLVFYGNGSLASEVAPIFDYFSQKTGCRFFIVDYRGYGFNPGRPSEAGLTADALGAYDTLREAGEFDRGVGVIGHSMGGAVSIALAEKRPVDRLLLISTFTSVRDVARQTMPLPIALIVRNDWPSERRLASILQRPSGERPSTIGLIHGARDEVIPVGMSRQLGALPGDGLDLLILERATHNDILDFAANDIIAFLKGQPLDRLPSSSGR